VGRALAEVEHRVAAIRAAEVAVAHLLEADGEDDVVHAGGHGQAGVAEGVHARCAVVLHSRDRPAEQLEGVGEGVPAERRRDGSHPCSLDAVTLAAGVGQCLVHRVAQQVLGAVLVQLAELRASHADNGNDLAEIDGHAGLLPGRPHKLRTVTRARSLRHGALGRYSVLATAPE
jgi:hypothetical protein